MLIANGNIKVKSEPTVTTDGDGNSVVTGGGYGSNIPCQYRANAINNIGVVQNNVFTLATYSMLIDVQSFDLKGSTIQLYNAAAELLGTYQVKRGDLLPHVELIKLIVS